MESPTIAAPFVVNMLQGAKDQGFSIEQILIDCEISPSILHKPQARITFDQINRLGHNLWRLLNDECYGLVDKPQPRNSFKLMCYSALHGDTLGDVLATMVEFVNILANSISCELVRERDLWKIRMTRRAGANIKNNYALEHLMLTVHRTLRWFGNTAIPVARADLDFPKPHYHSEYRYIFFGAPCHFDQARCALHFDSMSMQQPNTRSMKELKHFLRHSPLTLLSQTVAADNLSMKLRQWLEQQLRRHQQVPNIDRAALQFDLHPQALRRQLKQENSCYQEIKMECRRDLAINLVNNQQDSIEEVAYKLGFADLSTFIRAFKSWTGLTPLAYRKVGKA